MQTLFDTATELALCQEAEQVAASERRVHPPEITLVADQHDDDVRVGVVPQLFQPPLHVVERHCAVRAGVSIPQATAVCDTACQFTATARPGRHNSFRLSCEVLEDQT